MMFDLLFNDDTKTILRVIRESGFEARFVGGCVRDSIIDINPKDIDFAVNANPDITVNILKKNNIRFVDKKGMSFGTVIAIVNESCFEITSLRKDLNCDGRYADVVYTSEWREDASRRDFTFNAMYVDEHGELYDFFGGLNDLLIGKVSFVGNVDQRVKEDYLRILRAFRFYARFGKIPLDDAIIAAFRRHAHNIEHLSGERIYQEIDRLFCIDRGLVGSLQIMFETGMMSYVFSNIILDKIPEAIRCVENVINFGGEARLRLGVFVILSVSTASLCKWNVSKKYIAYVQDLSVIIHSNDYLVKPKKYINKYGTKFYNDGLIFYMAIKGERYLNLVEEGFCVPVFPITNKDIMERGLVGPQIKNTYNKLYNMWLEGNCEVNKEDLLSSM